MSISSEACIKLRKALEKEGTVYCSGLFLSARWMVISQLAADGLHLIMLPDKESAEYCASDLYNLVEGDRIFFLPSSGKNIEKSNFKSSLNVQRTSAVNRILEARGEQLFIVSYPDALKELIPSRKEISENTLHLKEGEEFKYDDINAIMNSLGFEKVDFVSSPGQFALRGALLDIFSYSSSDPYRISFWGDEIEEIHSFDCNTQLSKERCGEVDIVSSLVADGDGVSLSSIASVLPSDSVVWLDSSELYSEQEFFGE